MLEATWVCRYNIVYAWSSAAAAAAAAWKRTFSFFFYSTQNFTGSKALTPRYQMNTTALLFLFFCLLAFFFILLFVYHSLFFFSSQTAIDRRYIIDMTYYCWPIFSDCSNWKHAAKFLFIFFFFLFIPYVFPWNYCCAFTKQSRVKIILKENDIEGKKRL